MKRIILYMVLIFLCQDLWSRVPPHETNFRSPVKHRITISGNFGELRGSHFHAGLDIKSSTGGEGDSIFAAEEGFISRIKIQRGGYGRAIYIDHPNGYTTVYAHLKSFTEDIASFVENEQNAAMSYEIDVYPTKGMLALEKGSPIGLMGNSGHSFGAHLHFEIRESVSDNPMNPLLFKIRPFDDRPPLLKSVRITGLDETFHKFSTISSAANKAKDGGYRPIQFNTKESIVGLSMSGFDQNMSGNKNGIYKIQLYVDEALHYEVNLNAFSFAETHLIEAHTDYQLKQEKNTTEVLLYKLPGNRLSIINLATDNGLIYLEKGQTKTLKLVLTDFDQNTTSQMIYVKRELEDNLLNEVSNQNKLQSGLDHELNYEGMKIEVKATSLLKDIPFPVVVYRNMQGGREYQIGDRRFPILDAIRLNVEIPDYLYPMIDKTGFMLLGSNPVFLGQKINGNAVETVMNDFGRYGFFVDTIPPKIVPLNMQESKKTKTLKFKITDNVNTRGSAKNFSYQVYLDGVWKPYEMKETTHNVYVPIQDLSPGEHHIMVKAEDIFQNQSFWESIFIKD